MSYLDSLESNLKNLENSQERNVDLQRDRQHRESEKAKALAAAPYAEELKTGGFAQELLGHATTIGFSQRTKVQPTWLGSTLRLQAKEKRLELRPTPQGVIAFFFEDDEEKGSELVDLKSSPEELAKRWFAA
jgi:hypothetical protein